MLTLRPGISSSWHQAVPGGQGHLHMLGRGAGGKSTLNGSCSWSNAGRERKSQFPQTQGPFFSHTNSFQGEENSLALETLCLLGGGRGGQKEAEATLRKALGTADHLGLSSNASKHVAKCSLTESWHGGGGARGEQGLWAKGRRSQNRASTAFRSLPVNESLLLELERGSYAAWVWAAAQPGCLTRDPRLLSRFTRELDLTCGEHPHLFK